MTEAKRDIVVVTCVDMLEKAGKKAGASAHQS